MTSLLTAIQSHNWNECKELLLKHTPRQSVAHINLSDSNLVTEAADYLLRPVSDDHIVYVDDYGNTYVHHLASCEDAHICIPLIETMVMRGVDINYLNHVSAIF